MPKPRVATDDEFQAAVSAASNWGDLFARLGYMGRPGGGTQQRIRGRVEALGLDCSHLRRKSGPARRWTDEQLTQALPASETWRDLAKQIGGRASTCRTAALSLGLAAEVERLDQRSHMRVSDVPPLVNPVRPQSLRDAALQLATAWYTLHGFETFIPVTQSVEDVDVRMGRDLIKVQVKTSTKKGSASAWNVGITHRENGSSSNRTPYRSGTIDEFFIVTLDGSMYRIPFEAVSGKQALNLGVKYEQYRVALFA